MRRKRCCFSRRTRRASSRAWECPSTAASWPAGSDHQNTNPLIQNVATGARVCETEHARRCLLPKWLHLLATRADRNERKDQVYYQAILQCTQTLRNLERWLD